VCSVHSVVLSVFHVLIKCSLREILFKMTQSWIVLVGHKVFQIYRFRSEYHDI